MSTQSEAVTPEPEGFIPLSAPELREREWQYVKECLDSGWISSAGPFVERFERAVAAAAGTKHAVATVNGTAALHVALLVTGVRPDEEVLVSSLTFIAPANAVRYVGAWPVFMDADPTTWQMDPAKVASFLKTRCEWRHGGWRHTPTGRRVRAILPVDILGHPCDMDGIREIARKHELLIVEDASESLGALYKGRSVGSLGDIGCFSFNGNKLITAGGGGMIVTDNAEWAARAKYLTTQAKNDPTEYVHHEVGFNYRLPNVLAAIGCAQLERLESYVTKKRGTAASYAARLAGLPGVTLMPEAPWAQSTFWLYTALFSRERYGLDRESLRKRLAEQHIQARPLWQPLHLSRAHAGSPAYHCDVAEALYRDGLSLPCSVGIEDEQVQRVTGVIRSLSTKC